MLVEVVNDLNIDDAFLWLLTIHDYENNAVLRAVNNLEPVVSRGVKFEAFPFDIQLPPDDGQKLQNVRISFANVTREATEIVRQYSPDKPPMVVLELVLSSNPDRVEKQLDFLTLTSATYDALTITFTLASTFVFNRKTCLAIYNSEEFPGMFYAMQ